MNRPSLAGAVAALRTVDSRYPWVGPTDDESDLAAVCEFLDAEHRGDGQEPDERGRWGRCGTCGTPWPCAPWVEGESLAVQALGRAADRVTADARAAWAGRPGQVPAQRGDATDSAVTR